MLNFKLGSTLSKTKDKTMEFKRHFTKEGQELFSDITFEKRSSEMKELNGVVLFEINDIIVPSFWSTLASDILAQKYFRKAGVPVFLKKVSEDGMPEWLQRSIPDEEKLSKLPKDKQYTHERDIKDIIHRLSGTWTYWSWKSRYFSSEKDARIFYEEISHLLLQQMAAPNSPQWFNTGINWAYGINGPAQGHYYVDPDTKKTTKSTDAYTHPQPHACFILSVKDDLIGEKGIMDLWTREARLFKYGSGTGTNFSAIRGKGEKLSGGGKSSGLMSFLHIGDKAAGAIKSGGTTRRAAKMVMLDLDHPEIEEFISWKSREESKAASLVAGSKAINFSVNKIIDACYNSPDSIKKSERFSPAKNLLLRSAISDALALMVPEHSIKQAIDFAKMGYTEINFPEFSTDWNSEIYSTIAGQNSNNSVRVPNEFMQSLVEDKDWSLYERNEKKVALKENRNPKPLRNIKARDLWDKIAEAAWSCADPGIQFHSTINEWHTSPAGGEIKGSNPCSEYMFLDNTACNLASINLLKFYDKKEKKFLIDDFRTAVHLLTVVLDTSVTMAQFPDKKMAELSYDYRTTGLGFANAGSLAMIMGHPYDSDEARNTIGAITAIMHMHSYSTSAKMAAEFGAFPEFKNNKEAMLRVIKNHRLAAYNAKPEEYDDLTVFPIGIDEKFTPGYLLHAAKEDADNALKLGQANGFRNAQVTAIAPTGTIGLLMDCDTTGIEPDYSLVKFKKLSDGGYFKIINQSVEAALDKLKYDKDQIKDITNHIKGVGSLENSSDLNFKDLKKRGFTDTILNKIESQLPKTFDIRFIFTKDNIGEKACLDDLRIPKDKLKDPTFDLLGHLGFSNRQIEIANQIITGAMTVENAPHLKESHYAVFDTASRGGKDGQRFISPDGHLKMMAAVQPFVSGAISKTINLPEEATIQTVKDTYYSAYKMAIKSIALYRDGSKLSQPLSSSHSEELFADIETENNAQPTTKERIVEITKYVAKRNKLPSRRTGYTQKAKIAGHSIYLRTGEYKNGQLGEIFIDMHREGAGFRSLMNCFAIAISLGLQHGVPLDEFTDAFVFTRFEPNGMVGGNGHIKMTTSVIDYIFRELAISYLDRYDLAHVDDRTTKQAVELNINNDNREIDDLQNVTKPVNTQDNQIDNAKKQGYTGDICEACGSMTMVRNGTCLKCISCGSTSGCS